jgi:hypothetical protein
MGDGILVVDGEIIVVLGKGGSHEFYYQGAFQAHILGQL